MKLKTRFNLLRLSNIFHLQIISLKKKKILEKYNYYQNLNTDYVNNHFDMITRSEIINMNENQLRERCRKGYN